MAIKPSLYDLSSARLGTPELDAFFKEVESESDRAATLAFTAALDHHLQSLLINVMRDLSPDDTRRIFHSRGAVFGNLSAKIDACDALNLITPQEAAALNVIRHLRNAAAHAAVSFSFENELVKAECLKLLSIPDQDDHSTKNNTARSIFTVRCYILMVRFLRRETDFLQRQNAYAALESEHSSPVNALYSLRDKSQQQSPLERQNPDSPPNTLIDPPRSSGA
jgi:hypothetical protein